MTVIELARTLGKALQEDATMVRLTAANAANDADTELGSMIENFNGMRAQLNAEIMKPEAEKDPVKESRC